MRRVMIGAIVALVLVSVGAWAQTTGTSAFGQLPPGEQKIARALFEAQTGPTRLTPDQIAEMKGREGWGRVFKQMKEQGLLTQKNLGQVVSNFERRHNEARGATTGRGRDEDASGAPRSEEHTSELQSLAYLVCRLLLEKKKNTANSRQCTNT